MNGESGTGGVGVQSATGPIPYVNPFFDLDTTLKSRAISLSGMSTQMSYWSDPFLQRPGAQGSLWTQYRITSVALNNTPGGVMSVQANSGAGGCLVDPLGAYPSEVTPGSWIGQVSANSPIYMFFRARLGTSVGWDSTQAVFMGLVDPKSNGVIGVGLGIGAQFWGAVGGEVNDNNTTTKVASNVAVDAGVWHDLELFTRLGHFWCKVDDGVAFDVGSIMPGTLLNGTPMILCISNGVPQPTIEVDHCAFACPANRPFLSPFPAHPFP